MTRTDFLCALLMATWPPAVGCAWLLHNILPLACWLTGFAFLLALKELKR